MEADRIPELEKRFHRVMERRNFDVNDVAAGREYIEAYVQFFKFAEREEEGYAHGAAGNIHEISHHAHSSVIP
ncbi:DUF6448 family protein [Dialister sp.]|uniref:DUF6448 family protein n=1 Tax=Dialister sp. TaxID=1955814 RepID=UPI003F0A54D8